MSHSRLTASQDQHLSVFTSLLADFCFYFQENQTYLYCFNTSVVRTVLLLESSGCVNRHKDTLKCVALNSQPSVKCSLDFLQHDTSSCAYDPELVSGKGESHLSPSMTNHPTVKTKQKIKVKSDQTIAKQYPTLESFALQVTHLLCFILYLFFSFIIVCSGRFCGLIVRALKFWNSAGKSPHNNHKIVSLYVRKTMISHGYF